MLLSRMKCHHLIFSPSFIFVFPLLECFLSACLVRSNKLFLKTNSFLVNINDLALERGSAQNHISALLLLELNKKKYSSNLMYFLLEKEQTS